MADKGPQILEFTANRNSIRSGQSVQLSWETSGATEVTLTGSIVAGVVDASGQMTVYPTQTQVYVLVARGSSYAPMTAVTLSPPSYSPPSYSPPHHSPPRYSPPLYSPPRYSPPLYSPPLYSPPVTSPPSIAVSEVLIKVT